MQILMYIITIHSPMTTFPLTRDHETFTLPLGVYDDVFKNMKFPLSTILYSRIAIGNISS